METTSKFIHSTDTYNTKSSDCIVPFLMKMFNPINVLDVGCGIGTWLHSFKKNGIPEIFGIDGDYVDRQLLSQFIPANSFTPIDLQKPFALNRKFDLVICLEVAEHLPKSAADGFINSLCLHADTIVFSAAIPGQGGQYHINEQWLDYWVKKFDLNSYKLYDVLRPILWNMADVDWWYKQNMVIFSKYTIDITLPHLPIQNVVHPQLFQQHLDYIIYLQQYVQKLESKLYV